MNNTEPIWDTKSFTFEGVLFHKLNPASMQEELLYFYSEATLCVIDMLLLIWRHVFIKRSHRKPIANLVFLQCYGRFVHTSFPLSALIMRSEKCPSSNAPRNEKGASSFGSCDNTWNDKTDNDWPVSVQSNQNIHVHVQTSSINNES